MIPMTLSDILLLLHFLPQILKRGCNVNDRDGLTDMTLLHYTCKSGAHGIGEYVACPSLLSICDCVISVASH